MRADGVNFAREGQAKRSDERGRNVIAFVRERDPNLSLVSGVSAVRMLIRPAWADPLVVALSWKQARPSSCVRE